MTVSEEVGLDADEGGLAEDREEGVVSERVGMVVVGKTDKDGRVVEVWRFLKYKVTQY